MLVVSPTTHGCLRHAVVDSRSRVLNISGDTPRSAPKRRDADMSREDFVAIASRVFSIYLLVTIVRSFPSGAAFLAQGDRPALVLSAVMLITGLVLCAVLWFFPLTIARKLLPVMKEPRSEAAMNAPIALSVGLTLIGCWALAYALPDTIYWAAIFLLTRRAGAPYYAWDHEHVASIVATVVQLVLAVWLIFGASGIRKLISRYRRGDSFDAT